MGSPGGAEGHTGLIWWYLIYYHNHIYTMGKTRKTYANGHDDTMATFHGLGEWYKVKFEKLGWMILAKEHGMYDKVSEYQNSLKRLKRELERKIKSVRDKDKKDDLGIMHHNVEILIEHVAKDFA
jgi:hypothetical protein